MRIKKQLIVGWIAMSLGLASCTDPASVEFEVGQLDPAELAAIRDDDATALPTLTNVGFLGATTNNGAADSTNDTIVGDAQNPDYQDTVTIFPGDSVMLGCNAANATSGELVITSVDTGIVDRTLSYDQAYFPSCGEPIETSAMIPGTYTGALTVNGPNGNSLSENITIIVRPRVMIENARNSGGKVLVDLVYPYGVDEATVTLNDGTTQTVAIDGPKDGVHRVDGVELEGQLSDQDVIVATVKRNSIAGPNDREVIGNRAPVIVTLPGSPSVSTDPNGSFVVAPTPSTTASASIQGCKKHSSTSFEADYALVSLKDAHAEPVWTWQSTENYVIESTNSWPSVIFAKTASSNVATHSGLWRTTSTDNDYWGLTFGYKSTSDFYLFDWKQGDQRGP